MDSVVCFLFPGPRNYLPEHVNVLERMVARHLPEPHRFVCVQEGFDHSDFSPAVEVVDMPPEGAELGRLTTPEASHFPTSYRRLILFSEWARCLGDRVLLLDIDCVILRRMTPLFAYHHDFVGWRPRAEWGNTGRLAGGTYLLRTGAHTEVWERFRGQESIDEARAAGWRGSDQAWISYCLADTAFTWPEPSGIYQSQDYYQGTSRKAMIRGRVPPWQPPDDAIICHFNGTHKPWDSRWEWVREAWR